MSPTSHKRRRIDNDDDADTSTNLNKSPIDNVTEINAEAFKTEIEADVKEIIPLIINSLSKIPSLKYLWDVEAVGVTIVLKPKEEDIDATKLFRREEGMEEMARHSGPDQPRIQM